MLNYLDYLFIYGIKQDFYVNHSYKYRTLFSSILSIFSLTLILFYIIFFGRNIFSYKNPILNQVELNYNIPNKINLSESNFFFAFTLFNNNYRNYIDPSIYEVEAFYIQITKDPITNNSNKKLISLDIISCDNLDFKLENNYLKKLSLSQIYCIKNISNIILNGNYIMDYWNYISINFKYCTNKSYCKSKEEIKETLQENYIGIFTSDININPDNFKKPISLYILNSYSSILQNINKEIWVFLKSSEFIIDNGLIMTKKKKEKYNVFHKMIEIIKNNINNESIFMKTMISSSSSKYIYTRTYPKIGNIISDITSFSRFTLVIGNILSCIIDRVYYRHYILSFFDSDEKKLKKFLTTKSININNSNINNSSWNNSINYSTEKNNNYVKSKKLELPKILNNVKNIVKINKSFNINNEYKVENFMKKHTLVNNIIENKYIHTNLLKQITICNILKKILCEKKEIIKSFRNISIYFEVIRYLKIFKDMNIIQKAIFEEADKKQITLNYNFKVNEDYINYIYQSNFKTFMAQGQKLK
jgi:hypothetical protein